MTSPEVWKPVPGYEGIYEISNFGKVNSIKDGERFPRKLNATTHYTSFSAKKLPEHKSQKSFYIHRLVAQVFIGPRPEGCIIRHLDGDRRNNHVSNLAYGTKEENVADTIAHGSCAKENNGRALFTNAGVLAVKMLIERGVSLSEIARGCGVSISTIHAIKTGRNWSG